MICDRLERLSTHDLSLDDLKPFHECTRLWEDFSRLKRNIISGLKLSDKDLNMCTAMVAVRMLYQSFQQPGAVANCTLEEFLQRKELVDDGKKCVVISVKEHKTGIYG